MSAGWGDARAPGALPGGMQGPGAAGSARQELSYTGCMLIAWVRGSSESFNSSRLGGI